MGINFTTFFSWLHINFTSLPSIFLYKKWKLKKRDVKIPLPKNETLKSTLCHLVDQQWSLRTTTTGIWAPKSLIPLKDTLYRNSLSNAPTLLPLVLRLRLHIITSTHSNHCLPPTTTGMPWKVPYQILFPTRWNFLSCLLNLDTSKSQCSRRIGISYWVFHFSLLCSDPLPIFVCRWRLCLL